MGRERERGGGREDGGGGGWVRMWQAQDVGDRLTEAGREVRGWVDREGRGGEGGRLAEEGENGWGGDGQGGEGQEGGHMWLGEVEMYREEGGGHRWGQGGAVEVRMGWWGGGAGWQRGATEVHGCFPSCYDILCCCGCGVRRHEGPPFNTHSSHAQKKKSSPPPPTGWSPACCCGVGWLQRRAGKHKQHNKNM